MADILSGIMTGASAIHGTIDNIMTNRQNMKINKFNREWEKYLLGLQQNFAANQAEIADQRTRNLYLDLQSPEAIRQQLEKAGMSVGMMYGQGGMGGSMQSGAQAQSPSASIGGTIPMQKMFDVQMAQMVANSAKTAAETDLLKQEKKDKEADTANKWKDLDVKTKQMVKMDTEIDEIKQSITESQQRIDNMIEEKANIIAQRKDIDASVALKNALKEYNQSLKKLNDIKIEWEPKQQKAQLENIKALTDQYRAAAKKMMAEAELTGEQTELLKAQAEDLKKKLKNEILLQAYELKEVKPAIVKEMNERTYQMLNSGYSEEQRRHYYDWVNNNIGQGCGDFLRVVNEDLFPF